eukprot:GHVS01004741.1.p1 GENE.GHVS01004741.1~~GHVS01004741.1.p1  ORF type:complete len:764 (+),score=110.17 GHVS01004741.1:138-2429(+)
MNARMTNRGAVFVIFCIYYHFRPLELSPSFTKLLPSSHHQQVFLLASAQLPPIYSSVIPSPPPAPILGGLCNLRAGNPCVPEATCHPSAPIVGEALCTCPRGYGGDGKRDGQGCVNIDECLIGSHSCNMRTQDCLDTPGDYHCVCKRGYAVAPDKRTCLDVDECTINNMNVCDDLTSKCYNLEGTYECRCLQPGTILDERSGRCRDLDECKDKGGVMNPCDQLCTNIEGSVKCGCNPGWTLGADQRTCLDNDECADGTHTCGRFEGAQCENTEGSFKCACSEEKGMVNSATDRHKCDNLNECATHPYVCGGAHTCCGDLMPPQRYACMLPLSYSSLATLQQPSQYASSSLGAPVSGFGSSNVVGPAAATIQALAAASSRLPPASPPTSLRQSPPMYGASNVAGGGGGSWGCFEENIQYVGWDISGRASMVQSAHDCQNRCQGDPGCDYFSFQPNTTECFLKASNFGRAPGAGSVSGPKFCVNLPSAQTPSNNAQPSEYQQQPGHPTSATMGMLGSLLGRYLQVEEGNDEEEEEMVVVVVAGRQTTEQIQQQLIEKASERLAKATAMAPSGLSGRHLQRLGVLRAPGAAGGVSGLLGVGRLASNLVPRLATGSTHCPDGFNYAQDLYRSRIRQQTVKTIQTAIVGAVNEDGSTTPGLTAETFTDGLVRNTNLLANSMAHWYTELATVPGEMGQVVRTPGVPMMAKLPPGMNPMNLPPEAAALGAALGAGLVIHGIDKAVYGNGPGDSVVLDRTGMSKKMAYGLV